MIRVSLCWSGAALVLLGSSGRAADDHFEKRVRPLLVEKCVSCHGPDKQKGGLRLDTKEGWRRGGDSGPAVAPGDPDKSPLIQAVRRTGELKMPPKDKLTDAEVAALVRWVKVMMPHMRRVYPCALRAVSAMRSA
ncbi:MAG: c-type cytochrome domain-containing protein [Gemmata sp.]